MSFIVGPSVYGHFYTDLALGLWTRRTLLHYLLFHGKITLISMIFNLYYLI